MVAGGDRSRAGDRCAGRSLGAHRRGRAATSARSEISPLGPPRQPAPSGARRPHPPGPRLGSARRHHGRGASRTSGGRCSPRCTLGGLRPAGGTVPLRRRSAADRRPPRLSSAQPGGSTVDVAGRSSAASWLTSPTARTRWASWTSRGCAVSVACPNPAARSFAEVRAARSTSTSGGTTSSSSSRSTDRSTPQGLSVSDDNLRANSVAIRGDTVLRIDLVGLRVFERLFMDQICEAHRVLGGGGRGRAA